MANQLDEAFSWLVVILGIIAGALSQFPEIWPTQIGQVTAPVFLVRLLILPVIFLVLVWLWSFLAREMENQAVLKSLSWMFASIIMIADIAFILLATYGPDPATHAGPGENFPQWITMILIILSPYYLTPFFYSFAIRPRMREIYKNSEFLHSQSKQALLYAVTVLSYLLSTGILIYWTQALLQSIL